MRLGSKITYLVNPPDSTVSNMQYLQSMDIQDDVTGDDIYHMKINERHKQLEK